MNTPLHSQRYLSVLLGLLAGILLLSTGCAAGSQVITGAERDQVLAYAEAKTDNVLAGYNANDYATFSRDFDDQMRQALTSSVFVQTRDRIGGQLGQYLSRQVDHVEKTGGFIVVFYNAKFEKADGVTVRVVFDTDAKHLISGLWFNPAP